MALLAIGDNVMELLAQESQNISIKVQVPCAHCIELNKTSQGYRFAEIFLIFLLLFYSFLKINK